MQTLNIMIKQRNFYTILMATIMCLVSIDLSALHIIGGDVIYECKGINTANNTVRFGITFTMYRDSRGSGAEFDNNAGFGVYRGNGTNWSHFTTINGINPEDVQDVPIDNANPCVIIPVNVGVQKGVYRFEVILPISNTDTYMIAYQRCCRNNTILNLNGPGDTGAAFTTEITPEAQRSCNNSPKFKSFPPVVICVNRPINFDHSAIDVDGDSLVYEFCSPLTAGGKDGSQGTGSADACTGVRPAPQNCLPPFSNVTFLAPTYSFSRPMGGDPIVNINDNTGVIGGSPNLLGQFVVGVCVKEYRNGILIGTLRRDFQFNVTTCETAVDADIKATLATATEYVINSCGEYTINFTNKSTDTRFIQNYFWEFDVNGIKQNFSTRDVTYTFPGVGTYKAVMILNKDLPSSANCSDTANIVVNLYPDIKADFDYVYDTCVAGPIAFKDNSASGAGPNAITKWAWDFTEGKDFVQNPNFEYEVPGNKKAKLIIEDVNKCRDTLVKDIVYYPVPTLVVIDPNTFIGCQPADIFFKNLTRPIDDTYKLEWDFGDQSSGSDLYSPTHTYENTGVYTVKLKITSPLGCEYQKVWPNLIRVVAKPKAGFSFSPEKPSIVNNTVSFTDLSVDASSYFWRFDTNAVSIVANPVHTFRDTGNYEVIQVVRHQSGCTDTAITLIRILPFINFYMPNAFTPNYDGLNDVFMPVGVFEGINKYDFTIWNRWGEQLFGTSDFAEGWNGRRDNQGDEAPFGVYAYVLRYTDPLGKDQTFKGHVTLIR
jgi:gliding motility-associated-like protein